MAPRRRPDPPPVRLPSPHCPFPAPTAPLQPPSPSPCPHRRPLLQESTTSPPPAAPQRRVRFAITYSSPNHQLLYCFAITPTSQQILPLRSTTARARENASGCTYGGAPSQGRGLQRRVAMPGHLTHPEIDEDGWTKVLGKRRSAQANSSPPAPRTPPPRSAFLESLRGRCLRCLAGGHRAADCREPVRCINCRRIGHKARECGRASHPPSGRETAAAHPWRR